MIQFIYNTSFRLSNEKNVSEWVTFIAKSEGVTLKKVFYNYVSPKDIRALNKKHLSHDYVTDVLTFDYSSKKDISGDVFICQEQVEENAKNYSQSAENETIRVVCHAILHLCGYSDTAEDHILEMRSKEDHYLKVFQTTFK